MIAPPACTSLYLMRTSKGILLRSSSLFSVLLCTLTSKSRKLPQTLHLVSCRSVCSIFLTHTKLQRLEFHNCQEGKLRCTLQRRFSTEVLMADARYCVEYATTGRASCKKCKQQIEKGSGRIGKMTPNPFSDDGGDMKVWYHMRCMFETLKVCNVHGYNYMVCTRGIRYMGMYMWYHMR